MGLFDSAQDFFNRSVASAERGTKTISLKTQLGEVNRKREKALSQLGESLYSAVDEHSALKQGREDLFAAVADCDRQREEILAQIAEIEAQSSMAKAAAASTRSCPNCGTAVSGDYKFCPSCGTSVPELKPDFQANGNTQPRLCPTCGTLSDAGGVFCMNCGTKLGKQNSEEPVSSPVVATSYASVPVVESSSEKTGAQVSGAGDRAKEDSVKESTPATSSKPE